jgi:hypothetical protein
MKTKELIKQLMEIDPSGEQEVCVGNVDIHFVSMEPAYYDGTLQILERDPNLLPYYNIVGAKYKRTGYKIVLHAMSISDAVSNSPKDFPIDYSELSEDTRASTKKAHDDLREWHRNLDNHNEWLYFLDWVKSQVSEEDKEDVEYVARRFFEKNVSPEDALPDCGIATGHNYVTTRQMQWSQKFKVGFNEGFFAITIAKIDNCDNIKF